MRVLAALLPMEVSILSLSLVVVVFAQVQLKSRDPPLLVTGTLLVEPTLEPLLSSYLNAGNHFKQPSLSFASNQAQRYLSGST